MTITLPDAEKTDSSVVKHSLIDCDVHSRITPASVKQYLPPDVADTIVFMDHGQIIESGKPSDVLQRPQHNRTQAFLSRVS